jgi:hypothetical protein
VTHIRQTLLALAALAAVGCGGGGRSQPKFPDLAPVKGVVKRGGQPVKGGVVQFVPEPDQPEFLINSEVGSDGTFSLTTVRTTDSSGERKPGAPPGKYKASYLPPLGDQTAGAAPAPVAVPGPFEVKAGGTEVTVDLPKK